MRREQPIGLLLVVGLVVNVVQQLTDEQLAAEAAREGSDGPAFVELVERFRQRVWHICYRLLGNEVRRKFYQKKFAGLLAESSYWQRRVGEFPEILQLAEATPVSCTLHKPRSAK